jgi:archaellum biogenesis protein FlaJ (TadC family)
MEQRINIGVLLHWVPPEVYNLNFIIIFIVLVINCFMLALTLRMLRGSHILVTLLYFVPFVWVIAITSYVVEIVFGGMLG